MGARTIRKLALLILLPLLSCSASHAGPDIQVRLSGGPPLPVLGEDLAPTIPCVDDSVVLALQESLLDWYLERGYPFASLGCYLPSPDTIRVNVVAGRHATLERVAFTGLAAACYLPVS